MPLREQQIAGEEIAIPTRLPMILKQFCKAAIRTQPYDLLKWSSAYFRALADGDEPPVKLRLEYPPPSTASGLTLGFLKVLLRQFGDYNKMLPVEAISRRWDCLCLDRKELNLIMMIGKFRRKCQVKKFLAIAVGLLGSTLFETMLMICELFTHEPDGGSAMVPVTLFMEIYGYLAGLRCDGSERSSSDEDPREFMLFDESNSSPCSKGHESGEDNVSLTTSQDTQADINLDLELASKDAADFSNANLTSHSSESPSAQKDAVDSLEGETLNNTTEGSSSDHTLKQDETSNFSASAAETSSSASSGQQQESRKGEALGRTDGSSNGSVENVDSSKRRKYALSVKERRKGKLADSRLLTCYPHVPGIGPRLSAEEVASVAIWMSECARLQEGMVGPRNLRHPQCPPLYREQLES